MKHVNKGTEPAWFTQWKITPTQNSEPRDYDNLKHKNSTMKHRLHKVLLDEQGWVCCYCGQSITETNSHIEHFRPRAHYPSLQLEYDNLYASCGGQPSKSNPSIANPKIMDSAKHCGEAKDDKFDENLAISPQDPDCEQRFLYKYDGKITPIVPLDKNAVYMCDLLKLDSPDLKFYRKEALHIYDDGYLNSLTDERLVSLQESYKCIDANGCLKDFGHVVARYIEQFLINRKSTP